MKNLTKITSHFLACALAFSMFISCDEEEKPSGDYSNGVFIINEGSYGRSNGSISFYNYDTDSVYNSVYKNVNGRDLGDVVQSISFAGNKAYIVVNNSNKVEIADKNTMEELGVIEGLMSPRYMVAKGNTGYISCWGNNSVMVVNLDNLLVTDTLPSQGSGPDKMLLNGSNLYVLNTGGYGSDSTICVFDTKTGNCIKKIGVSANPRDIVEDKNGNIWVLTGGKEIYNSTWSEVIAHSPSMLIKLDPKTNTIVASGKLFDEQHPTQLEIDNDGTTLILGGGFGFGGIYSIEVSGTSLKMTKISNEYFYGIDVDPSSGVIFATQSGNFSTGGKLLRLKADGTVLGTYTCEIGTSGAGFKEAAGN